MARLGRGIAAVFAGLVLAVGWHHLQHPDGNADPLPAWATCAAPAAHVIPGAKAAAAPVQISLVLVADLEQPTAAAPAGDGGSLVTLREHGVVRVDRAGEVTQVLDLTGDLSLGTERGVLGLAIQPDGRAAFVTYTASNGAFTLVRVALPVDGVDPPHETILTYPDAHRFHNGGHLAFGPDGMLYVGLGDGGDEYTGDPNDDGQSLISLFGKILRIDVTSKPGDYLVPDDNPYVARTGARAEIWASGLRNPWRFAFDADTGDLWVADVGQFCWEEINRIPADRAGANFGWNRFEGGYEFTPRAGAPAEVVWPLYQYRHVYEASGEETGACAVVGGSVYRGAALPALDGWFVYSDFCAGTIWALDATSGDAVSIADLADAPAPVQSFATDEDGELLVLTTTQLLRITPAGSP
jgi:glucose/arabinose dehydrogenase